MTCTSKKVPFKRRAEAERAGMKVYKCPYCRFWHRTGKVAPIANPVIKTSLICLGIAIAFRVVFAQTSEAPAVKNGVPREIIFMDKIHGPWMRVIRSQTHDAEDHNYDPSYTRIILEKELRPMAKKLPSGDIEIWFRSEIAKDIP